jgi:hypothetical protein
VARSTAWHPSWRSTEAAAAVVTPVPQPDCGAMATRSAFRFSGVASWSTVAGSW